MRRHPRTTFITILALGAFSSALLGAIAPERRAGDTTTKEARVARGAHLVKTMGCNDCHTPWKMGPKGPGPDMSRALTGHPEDVKLPAPPALPPGPWTVVSAATNTAYAGPWGISFSANLTPDPETLRGRRTPFEPRRSPSMRPRPRHALASVLCARRGCSVDG